MMKLVYIPMIILYFKKILFTNGSTRCSDHGLTQLDYIPGSSASDWNTPIGNVQYSVCTGCDATCTCLSRGPPNGFVSRDVSTAGVQGIVILFDLSANNLDSDSGETCFVSIKDGGVGSSIEEYDSIPNGSPTEYDNQMLDLCDYNVDNNAAFGVSFRYGGGSGSSKNCAVQHISVCSGFDCPTKSPSAAPSISPSQPPSSAPSTTPTQPPSLAPSISPTQPPSIAPTQPPSISPTQPPSAAPSTAPSVAPSISPTQPPSAAPSISPTQPPSVAPITRPNRRSVSSESDSDSVEEFNSSEEDIHFESFDSNDESILAPFVASLDTSTDENINIYESNSEGNPQRESKTSVQTERSGSSEEAFISIRKHDNTYTDNELEKYDLRTLHQENNQLRFVIVIVIVVVMIFMYVVWYCVNKKDNDTVQPVLDSQI